MAKLQEVEDYASLQDHPYYHFKFEDVVLMLECGHKKYMEDYDLTSYFTDDKNTKAYCHKCDFRD